jgi:hypothetical protein
VLARLTVVRGTIDEGGVAGGTLCIAKHCPKSDHSRFLIAIDRIGANDHLRKNTSTRYGRGRVACLDD